MFRSVLALAVVCVIATSTVTLFAGPQSEEMSAKKTDWLACPWPPCMMPCAYPPEPEVLCKYKGKVVETSFACCCCGGGTAMYKWL
jgi:hypothetical protein